MATRYSIGFAAFAFFKLLFFINEVVWGYYHYLKLGKKKIYKVVEKKKVKL
jgi:hypothetical protein